MGAIDSVPLLLAAAERTARRFEESVSEILKLMHENGGQTVFVNGLRMATVEIEVTVVGVFSLFEARMQPNFPRGSFFKQLRKHLIEAGQSELADQVHYYYLAVNVLKHGRGSSYEELRKVPNLPFVLKQPEDIFSMRVISQNLKAFLTSLQQASSMGSLKHSIEHTVSSRVDR